MTADLLGLTEQLCDIPSVSGDEVALADVVEARLRKSGGALHIERIGANVVARTELGRAQRIVIGGHIDTVGARYLKRKGAPAVELVLTGNLLGTEYKDENALSWNVISDPPPAVPGTLEAAPPNSADAVLRIRALLLTADEAPFSLVIENYSPELVAGKER